MKFDTIVGMLSDIIQSGAILLGLWLTVKSWQRSYDQTIKAQNENLRNMIWDRAGSEIFSSLQSYNNWLIELSNKLTFFIEADSMDRRFLEKEQSWRMALLEVVNKLGGDHKPYQDWKDKVEYYKPALKDINEVALGDAIQRHGEILQSLNEIIQYEDVFPGVDEGKEIIKRLRDIVGSQGVQAEELQKEIHQYCMNKTFFLDTTI